MLEHQYLDRGSRRFPQRLSEWGRRQQDVHVRAFLGFAEKRGRRRLQELTNLDVADFINEVRNVAGERRAYRYALDLARLVERFQLAIRVPALRQRMEKKRLARIQAVLDSMEGIDAKMKARILEAFRR